jgi:hypothetical protein
MEFTFVPPSGVIGKTIRLTTEPVAIQLKTLLDEKSEVPDAGKLKGIATINPGFIASMQRFAEEHQTWLIVAGGVLVLGLAGVTYVVVQRGRTRAMSPEMIARKRLRHVAISKDAPPQVVAGAMVELADIARQYAAAQFRLPKADRTTEELLEDLSGIDGVPLAELKQMLMQFDQVKFAGAMAHADDVHAAVLDVTRFVEATCRFEPQEQMPLIDSADEATASGSMKITPGGEGEASVLDVASITEPRDEAAVSGRASP